MYIPIGTRQEHQRSEYWLYDLYDYMIGSLLYISYL